MESLFADARVTDLLASWIERLITDPDHFNSNDVVPLVTTELGLRWPWCVMGVLEVFDRMVRTKSANVEIHVEVVIHAPPLAVWFVTELGESLDEARKRWSEINTGVLARFDEAEKAAAGGFAPKKDAEHLRKWGRWFYERRIARPPKSERAVAKSDRVDRKTVRAAVLKAGQLLNLAGYVLRPPGENSATRAR